MGGGKKKSFTSLDFTMCNPPFYASRDEMIASARAKERPPFSVSHYKLCKQITDKPPIAERRQKYKNAHLQACTGAEIEMVTPGGEIAFVTRMIDESLRLRERVIWYTSMLGKLSSVSVIVEKLIQHGNHNYAVTEFVQGSKTKRWAVAWSWGDLRPAMVRHPMLPGATLSFVFSF